MSSTRHQVVLELNDEEFEVLRKFRAKGYEGFGVYVDHIEGIRGDGGEVYVEGCERVVTDPPQLEVVAALLNGVVRAEEAT